MPTVAICVCTRDRPRELAETLASIPRSAMPVSRVVVSDDGSDPATAEVCEVAEIAPLYVRGPGRGLGANRNHALSQASQDLVLFLDDDCLLGPEFLSRAIARMADGRSAARPDSVIVTGSELNAGHLVRASAQTFLGFQARPYRPGEAMSSIVINATLFPRSVFATHRFDENIRYGYDEVDLASRAVAGGWQILECPEATNDHRPSPRARGGNDAVLNASRLYVTLKRYALTERRPGKAVAFAVVASLHVLAAGLRSRGALGLRDGGRAVVLASRYLVREASNR